MVWSYNLNWGYPLTSEVDRWRHKLDHVILSQKGFWPVNNMRHVTKVTVSCIVSFNQGLLLVQVSTSFHIWKLMFQGGVYIPPINHLCTKSSTLKTEMQNSLLSNINDNGDNNKKTECLKTWVEMFRVRIFLVKIFRGKIHLEGNWRVGVFWGEFSWHLQNYNKYFKRICFYEQISCFSASIQWPSFSLLFQFSQTLLTRIMQH